MRKNKIDHYQEILKLLQELKSLQPKVEIGKHIATVLEEHNIWILSDKKFYDLLLKYKAQLELFPASEEFENVDFLYTEEEEEEDI
jgi:hypothetical protein